MQETAGLQVPRFQGVQVQYNRTCINTVDLPAIFVGSDWQRSRLPSTTSNAVSPKVNLLHSSHWVRPLVRMGLVVLSVFQSNSIHSFSALRSAPPAAELAVVRSYDCSTS